MSPHSPTTNLPVKFTISKPLPTPVDGWTVRAS